MCALFLVHYLQPPEPFPSSGSQSQNDLFDVTLNTNKTNKLLNVNVYKSCLISCLLSLSYFFFFIKVDNLCATLAPIFLEVLQSNMPAGVEMTVKEVCKYALFHLRNSLSIYILRNRVCVCNGLTEFTNK